MARLFAVLATLSLLALARGARAQSVDDGGTDAGTDGGALCTPLSPTADGGCGLQETTFDSNLGCTSGSGGFAALLGLLGAAALLVRGRTRGLFVLALFFAAVPARAQELSPYPPFSTPEPLPQRVAITANPLSFYFGARVGLSASVMLVSHHGLELTLYRIDQTTGTDSNNEFTGWGQEIGYRYYSGENGPRGFFIGPSLLLGNFTAIPLAGGDQVHYHVPGVALDLGYQALLFDHLVIGLGAGAQYTRPSVQLPRQEIPTSTYANAGVRPRVLFALGFSFLSI